MRTRIVAASQRALAEIESQYRPQFSTHAHCSTVGNEVQCTRVQRLGLCKQARSAFGCRILLLKKLDFCGLAARLLLGILEACSGEQGGVDGWNGVRSKRIGWVIRVTKKLHTGRRSAGGELCDWCADAVWPRVTPFLMSSCFCSFCPSGLEVAASRWLLGRVAEPG